MMVQTRSSQFAVKKIKLATGHNSRSDVSPRASGSRPEQPWQLNFDVLLIIATYANPRDLFYFAFTCKHIWDLLTDTSSELIWRTARSKIDDLPDCPSDLAEREYAHLAFCPRCHGCGKYTDAIFWEMRRRYCPDCQTARLCSLSSCPLIRKNKYVLGVGQLNRRDEDIDVLPLDKIKVSQLWIDREQMESFMEEYKRSHCKKRLLDTRKEHFVAINKHANECRKWQWVEQQVLQKERQKSIFERLKRAGYEREVAYCGRCPIQQSRKSFFDTTKPLTDKEWDRVWPSWLVTMNSLRLSRLELSVYQSRRYSLVRKYNNYVRCPPPNAPSFDLLPHVADVSRFPPFRDAIRSPEGTPTNDTLFASGFAQLPEFVHEWKKKIDIELAELVQIPSDLSSQDTSCSQVTASSSTPSSQSSQAVTDKLRLACAMFRGGDIGIFSYPDILFIWKSSTEYPKFRESDFKRIGSIKDGSVIKHMEDAPYVVQACGFDPNVATAGDMDRRNARIKCVCGCCRAYSWREAVWHSFACPRQSLDAARWQLVDDDSEDMAEIRAAELADDREATPHTSQCLLCRPRVGDAKEHYAIMIHLIEDHNVKRSDIKRGVHYLPLATEDYRSFWKVRKGSQGPFKYEANWNRLLW